MTHEGPFDKPICSPMMENSDSLAEQSFSTHSFPTEIFAEGAAMLNIGNHFSAM